MPTYEYECKACGHEFETMHGMTAPVLRKCPKCARLKLVRLISGGAGVIFKGSGFYETDYKRNRRGADSASDDSAREKKDDKPAETPKADVKAESKNDRAAAPKTDSKPEPKPKRDGGSKKD